MRLSFLEEFIELSRMLNYNEAARSLHISQSTLSKHIQTLEDDLRVKLFERDKHHVVLTSHGEVFLKCASTICADYQTMKMAFAADVQNRYRLFISGLIDSPGEFAWLSQASNKLKIKQPNFSPHFVSVGSVSPVTQVINEDVDCAVIAFNTEDYDKQIVHDLVSVQVAKSPMMIVVSSKNPLAEKDSLDLNDLEGKTFVHMMGPRMTSGWTVIKNFLERHGIQYYTKQTMILSVYDYVGINLEEELLILPKCETRRQDAKNPDRKLLSINAKDAVFPLNVVYRKSNKAETLQDYINELKITPL